MDKIRVTPGLAMPFFPMRPTRCRDIKTAAAAAEVFSKAKARGSLLQPKLNGDRVEAAKHNGRLLFANRHGNWYNFSVKNASVWSAVEDGTVMDGEVWKGNFYPFEAMAVGSEILVWKGPHARAAAAEKLCRDLGQEYLFPDLTLELLEALRARWSGVDNPEWEGMVEKAAGSPYICLGSAAKESDAWNKYRWS